MHGYVVDIDFVGQEPKKSVADDFAADLRQDGSSTGHLELFQKEVRAPWMLEGGPFNGHDFVEIG